MADHPSGAVDGAKREPALTPGELAALFARLAGETGIPADVLRAVLNRFLDPEV